MNHKGVGDTIETILASTGAKTMIVILQNMFETDCHCSDRKQLLNEIFPYDSGTWRERLDAVIHRIGRRGESK